MRKDKRFELRIDADTLDRFTSYVGKGKRSKVIVGLIRKYNANESAVRYYKKMSKK
jgi:hypothetical protein